MSDEEVKTRKPRKKKAEVVAQMPIDWRSKVSPEHVVLNRHAMAKLGVNTKILTPEETEKYLREVTDDKKIIKLSGFRELLRIRGYSSLSQNVKAFPDGTVACECTIVFAPHKETNWAAVSYTGVASAGVSNVAPEYSQFLVAIASNRAFCRTVREFLGISTVSDEELNPNEEVKVADSPSKPIELVKKKCEESGISFETLKKALDGRGLSNPDWISFESLPVMVTLTALEIVKSLK